MKTRIGWMVLCLLVACQTTTSVRGEDGYALWLRYCPVADAALAAHYRASVTGLVMSSDSPTLRVARAEAQRGLSGLLGGEIPIETAVTRDGLLVAGIPAGSRFIASLRLETELGAAGMEGFVIRSVRIDGRPATVIAANSDVGVLYGVFRFLSLIQTRRRLDNLTIVEAPRIEHRMLDHWDNLDGSIERGYAGRSLWQWDRLPGEIDPRYVDYARANASIGINGSVLTNVNADATFLTREYLAKAAALADVFRPYGIHVYLTARFSAPIEIGGLDTADPLDPAVARWWKSKVDEVYELIPDFGGFVVKANSEGQPGPQDYGRSHAEGANMLADAVAVHRGIVLWRAFVYSGQKAEDRAKQANLEFEPLDGRFRDNVLLQVKNGPIDFQPREPFHPLFGRMPETPLAMEFQITKEYLGQKTHLVYLAPMWKEVLESDTYAKGPGSTVARVVDGTLHGYGQTAIAGVSNIGSDRNWAGSEFNQANWYAFGRLAWDHARTSEEIADDWIRMTFTNDERFVSAAKEMMMASWEACVAYMTPLGLNTMMSSDHYGPGPWVRRGGGTYANFHHADSLGIGFDRTESGSDAVGQYFPPLNEVLDDINRTPEKYLLWFHHVPWDYGMPSGRTLWDEMALRYQHGVEEVRRMQATWASLGGRIDGERYGEVRAYLSIQEEEARWWRGACLLYFQQFSNRPLPDGVEPPEHTLEEYMQRNFRRPPG